MKINLAQLTPNLSRRLAPFYWLSGDDAVLQEEALSLILEAAQQHGFSEKHYFTLSTQFDDTALWQTLHNRCLWQQKKIVLIHLNAGKLTQKGATHFLECLSALHQDTLLIIHSPKLETNQYQSAWYKTAEVQGVFVTLWPLTEKEWQKWLEDKIKNFQLKLDESGINALLLNFDGNLLAAKNALQTLKLAYPQQAITATEVLALITPQGDYNVNQLTDAILQGSAAKAERILQYLRLQGLEIILILWAVLRELRLLSLLSAKPVPSDSELASYRLWPQRKTMLEQAAQRLANHEWKALFTTAALCDKIIKGAAPGDPWVILSALICTMASAKAPVTLESSANNLPIEPSNGDLA